MKIAILGTGLIGKKIFTYLNDEEVLFFSKKIHDVVIGDKNIDQLVMMKRKNIILMCALERRKVKQY